jgi:transcriptional regulator with XRE-family HTH domain
MDLRDVFATNLRRLRHAKGLSQDDLAYEAEVSRLTLAGVSAYMVQQAPRTRSYVMSHRVEYLLLPDEVVGFHGVSMGSEEFQKYARERLISEAKLIYQSYDPNHQRVEALRLMDGERELCRVELGDVIGVQR